MNTHDEKVMFFFEKALDENDNLYSIISKIMWWELFLKLNKQEKLIKIFEDEYSLTELFNAEIEYHSEKEKTVSVENKLNRFKIDFFKMLYSYFKNNEEPSLEKLNIRTKEKNTLDKNLLKQFNQFKKSLLRDPEYWKMFLKEYRREHIERTQQAKKEIEGIYEQNLEEEYLLSSKFG